VSSKGFKTTATDRATRAQAAAVRNLVRENVAAAERVENAAVRPLIEVLLEARKELREDLAKWMATVENPEARFTAHQMRVFLRSIEGTLETLGIRLNSMLDGRPVASVLDRVMLEALRTGSHAVGALSVKNLEHEIAKLGHIFGRDLIAPQIDTAAVLARGDKLLLKRYPSSARRYAGKVGEDLRFQISVGVARGETFEQLVQRLRRLGGPSGPVPVRGIFGNPNAIVEDIPEGLFARYESAARRLIRTEMMHAYNIEHVEGIRVLNATRDPDEPPYLRRCDAAADSRVCPLCRSMDGVIVPVGKDFSPGYGNPPFHPCCRCIELAWRADWPAVEIPGGVKPATERSRPAI
jgi:SPP1 gp7 family putative phage head morphogenesis protein